MRRQSTTQQIRFALHDFKFAGMAGLSFIKFQSGNCPLAIDDGVCTVRSIVHSIGIPILDHLSAILSCSSYIRVGRNGHHHMQHIAGIAGLYIGRTVQSIGTF